MATSPDNLKWCPYAKGILAATADGRLIRFFKTAEGKYTNPPRYEIVTPRNERHQITANKIKRDAQWWICSAWHGKPPHPDARAFFEDGDRSNFRPENLRWISPKAERVSALVRTTQKKLNRSNRFRTIRGLPYYFVSDEGLIIRVAKNGQTRLLRGSILELPGHKKAPAIEIVADVWLPTPRPSPFHRAEQIDTRDPNNLSPENLRWQSMQRLRPTTWNFRPDDLNAHTHSFLATPDDLERSAAADRAHEFINAASTRLFAQGAKIVRGCPRVWITPDGDCVITHDDRIEYAQPNAGGYVKAPGLDQDGGRLHLPTAVADAFAGTQHAPNLPDPCPHFWTVHTIDGSANCHPNNLIYRVSNRTQSRPVYQFIDRTP